MAIETFCNDTIGKDQEVKVWVENWGPGLGFYVTRLNFHDHSYRNIPSLETAKGELLNMDIKEPKSRSVYAGTTPRLLCYVMANKYSKSLGLIRHSFEYNDDLKCVWEDTCSVVFCSLPFSPLEYLCQRGQKESTPLLQTEKLCLMGFLAIVVAGSHSYK